MSNFTRSITDSDEEESSAQASPADIRLAAMNLLARREHSMLELRNKLKRRFPCGLVMEEQLSRLAQERLQSDARFTESYVRYRSSRGYGPVRLREELRERGISEMEVDAAIKEQEIDWFALAADVIQKKFGTLPSRDVKEKSKRVRFMQYRGFLAEHYRMLLRD
jgi:regulatory protein